MPALNHLRVEEIKLPAGREWMDTAVAWRFLRLRKGAAYWLGVGQTRSLIEGETLVAAPGAKGLVRASQIGDVVLQVFNFAPDLLYGFFSLAERHFFETLGTGKAGEVQCLPSTHPVSRHLAASAADHSKSGELARRARVLGIVAAMFDEEVARHQPPASRSTTALSRFTKIIAKMPETELINHTPETLARLCGCSQRHFNRLFRRHFSTSVHARQTELRLLKSRELLSSSNEKIIHIALESGYRNLSLFNFMFKKRFGMTPSQWRNKATKKNGKTRGIFASLALCLFIGTVAAHAAQTNAAAANTPLVPDPGSTVAPEKMTEMREALRRRLFRLEAEEMRRRADGTNAITPAASTNNSLTFEVKSYELLGNTLLPDHVTGPILEYYTGPAVAFDSIRQCLAELQSAYRERGYVTVSVGLPPQQLTNGIVKVQVIEGRLADIKVVNNRYFTVDNVLRQLPSLRTNIILNGLVIQQELDRANANRDRQIYPVISPGPEPGTSALELRVKDRLPLHFRFELNNNATPESPDLRMNLAAQYNNLWQLDHQIGVQYTFTPQELKQDSYTHYDTNGQPHEVDLHVKPYDQPLIDSYSFFYRMPLSGVNGSAQPRDYSLNSFGYDEATHRFRPPQPTGGGELLFYGSRSDSDTGSLLQNQTLTAPDNFSTNGGLLISDQTVSRTLNPNENAGARFIKPLPPLLGMISSVSLGVDYKNYRSTTIQTRTFQATLFVPSTGSTGPPFDEFPSPPSTTDRETFASLEYLPFSVGYSGSRADKFGATYVDLGSSFQFENLISSSEDFQAVAGNTNVTGRYVILTGGLTREQKIHGDWGVRFQANAQWANEPLISNEQFSLGGQSSVRGYNEGEQYGDIGWRVSFEPHSPYLNLGLVDNTAPMMVRLYSFVDYGQRHLIDNPGPDAAGNPQSSTVDLFGTGFGFNASIGQHVDFRAQIGIALLDTPPTGPFNQPSIRAGDIRVSIGLGAQF